MKKLVILIVISVVICICAKITQAQNNMPDNTIKQFKNSECSLFFSEVLNGKDKDFDRFENKVEYILETGYFWENCVVNQLKNGQNVIINYIGYTNANPTKTELKYLIKSAVKFKEELEDYAEEQEPKNSFLYDGDRYIFLQTDKDLIINKKLQKYLNKENKKFYHNLKTGKIIINIKILQNNKNTGAVMIEAEN